MSTIGQIATRLLRERRVSCTCGWERDDFRNAEHAPDCAWVSAVEQAWDDAVGIAEQELADALDAQEEQEEQAS